MRKREPDQGLSLEEIEGDAWGDPPPDATRLVATVYGVRRKPIESLDAEDLRITILQCVGLPVLIPLALGVLEEDPLAEGDMYPGALLGAVVRAPAEYWDEHPDQAQQAEAVAVRALAPPEDPYREARDIFGPYIEAFRVRRVPASGPSIDAASPSEVHPREWQPRS